jgi:hypothetical protein
MRSPLAEAATLCVATALLLLNACATAPATSMRSDGLRDADRIRPWSEDPRYWQFKGEPVLLLGGSWQDNLFNHPRGLQEHLDVLRSAGGNYVRNTMSHRNEGNVFAYAQDEAGRFDLDRFNDEYWRRFARFLELTFERDMIVQIEIFDPWDKYEDHQSRGGWSRHPFNPANNVNFSPEESGLPTVIDYPPTGSPSPHPFFRTVPSLDDNELVLRYQQAFVDKMLSYSLRYPHVLYCIHNETGERVEFGDHWAAYIHQRAAAAGVTVHITDMRRNEHVRAPDHTHIYDAPELYTFVDISQNNAFPGLGQGHYDNILWVRERLSDRPRPINNNKNYGGFRHGDDESIARMARIVFAGGASARFHRPHPLEDPAKMYSESEFGLGLGPRAQAILRSLRMATDELDVARTEPRNDLLGDREPNEAYLLARPGSRYAIYFPNGGSVTVALSGNGNFRYRWINLERAEWSEPGETRAGPDVRISTPSEAGHWIVVFRAHNSVPGDRP